VTEVDAETLLSKSGADGVMIGRGAYGRPWFINQVGHYLATGEKLPNPSMKAQLEIIQQHVNDMIEHYGEDAGVKIARKHVGWYSKGLEDSADFRVRVNQAETLQQMQNEIQTFYGNLC
jgi:tRNA-dihydrouridine synthase B